MKTVTSKSLTIKIPTSMDEITPDWLIGVSKGINPAPYYSLVALVFKDTLGLLMNVNKSKNASVSAVPLFVKTNSSDDFCSNITTGTPIISAPSSLAMGHHIICPQNTISPAFIKNSLSKDSRAYILDSETIYTVEFKLIPNSDIHGTITKNIDTIDNPFLEKQD